MTAAERLAEWGYEDVVIFDNPSYDNALIGVSDDNRAIYDYDKMVIWLAVTWAISREEAIVQPIGAFGFLYLKTHKHR